MHLPEFILECVSSCLEARTSQNLYDIHTASLFREIPVIPEGHFLVFLYCFSSAILICMRLHFLKLCATTKPSLVQSKISR